MPGGGQVSLMVERELALVLMERRLQAGTTFAAMVRAGDPDLAQLLLVRIAELRAEQRGIDLDLARLAPAATLDSMAIGATPTGWCLSKAARTACRQAATAPATGSR